MEIISKALYADQSTRRITQVVWYANDPNTRALEHEWLTNTQEFINLYTSQTVNSQMLNDTNTFVYL